MLHKCTLLKYVYNIRVCNFRMVWKKTYVTSYNLNEFFLTSNYIYFHLSLYCYNLAFILLYARIDYVGFYFCGGGGDNKIKIYLLFILF